jgi:uncharacterized protein DUF3179
LSGREFHFHLAGINNQNFLMRDDETGTWWQQVSGKAISGPLAGQILQPVNMDELTFALWRAEYPAGTVLMPVSNYESKYEASNWEQQYTRLPVVLNFSKTPLTMRTIVVGVELNGSSRAYPLDVVLHQSPIQDEVGGVRVLIAVGPDNKSIRAFRTQIDGKNLELFKQVDANSWSLIDPATHGQWNFQGCPTMNMPGMRCLEQVPVLRDYWFDWRQYHPSTSVYLH